MGKGRLEAFSDGVMAVIITIMVLELKAPKSAELGDLVEMVPELLAYVLSFVYVGIYWNNHHHMLHATKRVSGGALWANLHLLFWLSLVPFITAWVADHPHEPVPTSVYGVVLLLAGFAYSILQGSLVAVNGRDSELARAVGADMKGKVSLVLYILGIGAACRWPSVAQTLYALVALMWLVPDRRIEKRLHEGREG